ncbi:MAG: LL-diaminopimelate aminotransferase [Deltaproteobacteria bacterium]|nr:LL-diaminopimelate aminotransferase [Deltaproteobacteria bacterium]
MIYSKRIQQLPPYPFADLDKKKAELKAQGKDLINLSIGDPDLPTPEPIVKCMQAAVAKARHHQYPPYEGTLEFKEAAARWYQRRFNVRLDPASEVLALIGSKEGIANVHYALVDPGDIVLVPTPGYPVYDVAAKFAGGIPFNMPLGKNKNFLPDFSLIQDKIGRKAKIMHLNYPNNPTAAPASDGFFNDAVHFAKQHNIMICHDAAYTEIYFDNRKPKSFLQTPGAKEVGIEFHSLSKTFNMTGWRIGFAVGNAEVLKGLAKIKTNVDSGQFTAVQEAAAFALDHAEELTPAIRATYQKRRDIFVEALNKAGFKVEAPKATFYVWMELSPEKTDVQFADHLMRQTGVIVTPGSAVGEGGENFIRFTLTAPEARLKEAVGRMQQL